MQGEGEGPLGHRLISSGGALTLNIVPETWEEQLMVSHRLVMTNIMGENMKWLDWLGSLSCSPIHL